MSTDRALRKQQQLNNLVYMVLNQAKPGDRIVDFCSGGVLCLLYPLVFPKIMRPCYIAFKVMILSGKIIVLTVSRSHGNQSYFFCLTSQGHVGIALAHVLPSCQVRAERRQRGRAQGHAGLTSALCIASSLLINMCHILCLEVNS